MVSPSIPTTLVGKEIFFITANHDITVMRPGRLSLATSMGHGHLPAPILFEKRLLFFFFHQLDNSEAEVASEFRENYGRPILQTDRRCVFRETSVKNRRLARMKATLWNSLHYSTTWRHRGLQPETVQSLKRSITLGDRCLQSGAPGPQIGA